MSQPVKLSDTLVLDARTTGEVLERSIAGQIEFWARIGQALEASLEGHKILALKRTGDARSIADCMAEIGTPAGQKRLRNYLEARPFPHFERAPGKAGFLVKVDEDGTRTVGKFVNRQFIPARRPGKK